MSAWYIGLSHNYNWHKLCVFSRYEAVLSRRVCYHYLMTHSIIFPNVDIHQINLQACQVHRRNSYKVQRALTESDPSGVYVAHKLRCLSTLALHWPTWSGVCCMCGCPFDELRKFSKSFVVQRHTPFSQVLFLVF